MARLQNSHCKVWLQNNVKCGKYHPVKLVYFYIMQRKWIAQLRNLQTLQAYNFLHFTTFCNQAWHVANYIILLNTLVINFTFFNFFKIFLSTYAIGLLCKSWSAATYSVLGRCGLVMNWQITGQIGRSLELLLRPFFFWTIFSSNFLKIYFKFYMLVISCTEKNHPLHFVIYCTL